MEAQYLYYAEMKIVIDSVELKEGKTQGRSEVEREKEDQRERTERKQRETERGVETIFIACASLTSAYTY